jgi:chitinase
MPSPFVSFRSRWFAAGALAITALLISHVRTFTQPRHGGQNQQHPLLVGYFPQWGLYYDEPYYVKNLVTNGGAGMLDQINYAQGFVAGGHCSVADPNADLNTAYTHQNSVSGAADDPALPFRGYFHQLKELKERYPRLKILISLEGKAADFAEDATPEHRREFVASCMNIFVRGRFAPGISQPGIFDGFDIDWESPHEEDAANFRALLEEFRHQMDAARPGLRLSIAVGHAPGMLRGTDFAAIAPLVDQVGVMNYDYTGPWSPTTGFLAPLFTSAADPHPTNSIEHNIADYRAAGVPAGKLLMGLPFYGYSWTAVARTDNGLFQPGHGVHSDQPYRYLRTLGAPFSAHRDPHSQAPWLFDGQTFWTYEDPISIRYKVSYAAHQSLGGVMIWELSNDTSDAELLSVVHRSLLHPISASDFAKVADTQGEPQHAPDDSSSRINNTAAPSANTQP